MEEFLLEFSGFISGLIGIVLGTFLSYIFFRKQNKDKYSASLFAEYKNIAQELAEILKDLLTLTLMPQKYSVEQCNEIDKTLGEFFFKYYLILPQPVLEEINCLHRCLLCGGKNIFIIKKEKNLPVLQICSKEEDIKALLEDVALVTSKRNLFEIYQINKRLPHCLNLRCQARHVITTMHDCWNLSNINKWEKQIPKKTIAKRKARKKYGVLKHL